MEYLVSVLHKVFDKYAIGKSLPIGPWKNMALIANALSSGFRKNDYSNFGYMRTGDLVIKFAELKDLVHLDSK